jgi:hypothetical protein
VNVVFIPTVAKVMPHLELRSYTANRFSTDYSGASQALSRVLAPCRVRQRLPAVPDVVEHDDVEIHLVATFIYEDDRAGRPGSADASCL